MHGARLASEIFHAGGDRDQCGDEVPIGVRVNDSLAYK